MTSNENNSYSSLSNQQSPLQRSQQQQQTQQHHHHHHHVQDSAGNVHTIGEHQNQKASKSRRHYHGHSSCNPCMGHFIKRDKNNEKDNTSLDAYDLASPCCEANCVPVKRRSRHHKEHKEHHHKHKHRDKERPPRPRSQHLVPQTQNVQIHTFEGPKHVSCVNLKKEKY